MGSRSTHQEQTYPEATCETANSPSMPIGKQSNKKCVSSLIYKEQKYVSGGFLPKWEHQWTVKEVEAGLGKDVAPLPTSSDQRTLRSPLSKRVTKELAQVSNIWQDRRP